MIYIVGGPPRSGKSIVRKKLLKEHKISGLSLDTFIEMLHKAMPELDINTAVDRKILNLRLWPFLEAFIETKMKGPDDFIIEGEYFSPDKIAKFQKDPRCKICFMLYPMIDLDKKLSSIREHASPKDWYNGLSDEQFWPFIEEWHLRSHQYKGQCEARKIKFFDTSFDFEKVVDEAVRWLMKSEQH